MSGTNSDTRTSKRPRQACLNCRRKKVKCHGERPSCSFCARLLQECVYPSTPWIINSDKKPTTNNSTEEISSSHDFDSRKSPKEAWVNQFGPNSDSSQNGTKNADEIGMPLSSNLTFSTMGYEDLPHLSPNQSPASRQPKPRATADPTILPPPEPTDRDHRLVQAATLLALLDFTACKHETAWLKIGLAVSVAQALHMMKEPEKTLSFSAQEERRRTLWSIYLLDKMATCGRDRPSLFLDRTIELQLPCSDASFWMSTSEKVVTLEGFNSLDDSQIQNVAPSALTIVLASVLNQTANYAFKHIKSDGHKPPWDHTSEYQAICSQLTRFETLFDSYGDIQKQILEEPKNFDGSSNLQITESLIFAYVLYNLSHCLLQHPFLLRRRLEDCSVRIPTRFFARAIESAANHAQEISRTLANATRAKYKVSATILGYSSLVAGSINGLFQHSTDDTVRSSSAAALLENFEHLKTKSRYWKTSARMINTLARFSKESARYSPLIDSSFHSVPLEPSDVELLYSICDYGTMSSSRTKDIANTTPVETYLNGPELEPLLSGSSSAENYGNFENLEDFSGLIEGILPHFFDHTNPQTMLDDFSSALGEFNGADCSAISLSWHAQS
ncbi:hypothetical protein J1614_008851 [Plenodomus biglobosus]|nr:hypothetical protein J1614_008851 [Plenodomus biglobosus]